MTLWAFLPMVRGLVFRTLVALVFVLFSYSCTPTFNRVVITITTGNDNANSDSEITATLEGQKKPICLKPSSDTSLPSDGICPMASSGITWDNWSTHSTDPIVLDTPKSAASGFTGITIALRQTGNNLGGNLCTTCDNWDIQGITVTVSDVISRIPPNTLVNVLVQPLSGDNCIARLKAGPGNATKVRFALDGSGSHIYADGDPFVNGHSSTCKNNGD